MALGERIKAFLRGGIVHVSLYDQRYPFKYEHVRAQNALYIM
jgi:hypothetical protein